MIIRMPASLIASEVINIARLSFNGCLRFNCTHTIRLPSSTLPAAVTRNALARGVKRCTVDALVDGLKHGGRRRA